MSGLVPRVPPEGTSAEHMSEFEVPLLGDARRRLGRWNEAVAALCAAWRWLRSDLLSTQVGHHRGRTAQFGGKIGAHDPQKVGAEFRSARHELSQVAPTAYRRRWPANAGRRASQPDDAAYVRPRSLHEPH